MATSDDSKNLAWRVEEACLHAWPSPRQVLLGRWLARVSGGPVRRTNSVNPLPASSYDPSAVIDQAQALYRAHGQATLFRVPSIATGMDAPLERLGFAREGETCTLFADLSDARPTWDGEVELTAKPSSDWLAAKARLTPLQDNEHWIYEAMLGAIVPPRAFAAARVEGEIASVAYGVIHDGILILESVATDAAHRQRGLARRTVGKLMDWAVGQEARGAGLQVVADNAPAHLLYKSLGFNRELYRYHYRREPAAKGLANLRARQAGASAAR